MSRHPTSFIPTQSTSFEHGLALLEERLREDEKALDKEEIRTLKLKVAELEEEVKMLKSKMSKLQDEIQNAFQEYENK